MAIFVVVVYDSLNNLYTYRLLCIGSMTLYKTRKIFYIGSSLEYFSCSKN